MSLQTPYKKPVFLFAFCIINFVLEAQNGSAVFSHLTTKNGLSNNRATVVLQDRRGFYWIGTQDGLNRFDGSSCKIFRNIKNDSTSLSHNTCSSILEDQNGDIWVGTSMGLNRYSYKTGRFERFFLMRENKYADRINMIKELQQDTVGNIWVSSIGIWQYNIHTKKWITFVHDPQKPSSIPEGTLWDMQYDKKNHSLWLNIDTSRVLFEIRSGIFYHKYHNPFNNLFLKTKPGSFVMDVKQRIWFINDRSILSFYNISDSNIHQTSYKVSAGVFRLSVDAENRIWIHSWTMPTLIFDPVTGIAENGFMNYLHPQSALSSQTTNLYTDSAGIYWVSSMEGVNIYNPKEQGLRYFLLPDKTGTGTIAIQCMQEQDENTVWLGTNIGLFKYDMLKNNFQYPDKLFFTNVMIKCLYLQNKSILWVGTGGGVAWFDVNVRKVIKTLPIETHTEFITADHQGNVWVGSWTEGLYKFSAAGELLEYFKASKNSAQTILHNNLIGFYTNPKGSHTWIGYNGGYGFCKLDHSGNNFAHYKIQTTDPYFNAINTVNCFSEDNVGNLWIGTNGGGLFYFDRQKNSFKSYVQSDGLKSNYINAILTDENNQLWIATSNGLSVLNKTTKEIINPAIDIEMASNDFLPSGLLRQNKKMLFFSANKLVEIDPQQFQQNSYPSRILFSGFKIFDKEYSLAENDNDLSASLSHRQNFFSLEYSLLNPDPNSNTKYAYQMKGFDKGWINASERRVAYYTNVPPGNYSFQVKATDESGRNYFSKPVLITIEPPFWKTWWFYTGIAILIISSLYLLYSYRVRQLKKIMNLRTKISRDLHDEVGATLSGIVLFSQLAKDKLPDENGDAGKYIERITGDSKDMVEKMNDIVWTLSPDNDSFETLINRLHDYAAGLCTGKNIQLHFNVDEKLKSLHLDMQVRRNIYLISKEALNNAVKYSAAKNIYFSLHKNEGGNLLVIKDDGKGFNDAARKNGNGIKNIKARSTEINAACFIRSNEEKGTTVEIKF